MKTLNLPSTMYKDNQTYYATLELERPAISVLAYSEKEARTKLMKDVTDKLTSAVNAERHYQRYAIGTASGCVFIVTYKYSHWEYAITGPARDYGTSCVSLKNYAGVCDEAREHARADFGGIVWEHSF